MRAIVFLNGIIHDYAVLRRFVRADDYLVAADGGARHCLAIDQRPHVIVGDLDSLDAYLVAQMRAQNVAIELHPAEKDETDVELAILRAIADGAQEVVLVGATGGRLDQTLANLLILAQRTWPAALLLLDGEQVARVLRSGETVQIRGKAGKTVSVIPLSAEVSGITYSGLAYPLRNAALRFGSTRGVSNLLSESVATIQIEQGLLLVIHDL
jgi:thiamine pyrophosphokinase